MKKYTLLYLLGCIALCSCGNQSKTDNNKVENPTEKGTYASKIVSEIQPIPSAFTHLILISSADVEYTQGAEYKMEIVGDSIAIRNIVTNFESNLLTISIKTERNPELNTYDQKLDATIKLSSPDLACVSVCGIGNFTTKGTWKGNKIELGTIGNGNINCDSIICSSFDYKSSGEGDATFDYVKAETTHFSSVTSTAIKANIDTDILMCENSSNKPITFTGKANKKEIYDTKKGRVIFE